LASPVIAMNSTFSRQTRSIRRELTMPCEYASSTALSNIPGACAGAPAASLR
jgi:hypothetical protein